MLQTRLALTRMMGDAIGLEELPERDRYLCYEYLCALETRTVHWSFISTEEKLGYGLTPRQDYGIDSMTPGGKKAVQTKWRPASGRVTFRELSTFYTLSRGIIDSKELIVATTPGCRLPGITSQLEFEHMIVDPENVVLWIMQPAEEYRRRLTLFETLVNNSWRLRLARLFVTKRKLSSLVSTVYPAYAELSEWVYREYLLSCEGLTQPNILELFDQHLDWRPCCSCCS